VQFSLFNFLQKIKACPWFVAERSLQLLVLSSQRELIVSGMHCSDGGGSMSDFARLQARGTGGESLHGPKSQSGG
jgi:hypothetical protein